jgi:glycolate oxidase
MSLRIPVMLAPVGSLESFHPGGGATAGRGASAFGVPIIVSSVTKPGLEEIAKAATGPKIFQLYVRGDTAWIDAVVDRAIDAGYDAFCITVDTASYSRRERDIVARFVKPWRAAATGHGFQAGFNWDHVRDFKDKHAIPLILKGIATAEDAALCCEHGVDGVYISNHGGRQLDHGRGSLDVLPEVMAAVRGRAKVMIDGSFCRGTDIVKAIALGADAVGMGRMYCYALAADGDAGVHKMLELLEHEVGVAMALSGARSLAELNPSFVFRNAPIVAQPHQHSAFPLLQETPEYRG